MFNVTRRKMMKWVVFSPFAAHQSGSMFAATIAESAVRFFPGKSFMQPSSKPTSSKLSPVFENDDFEAVPCRDCDVPGYLVLIPKQSSGTIAALPVESQKGLGPVLARLEHAVQQATAADHVYVLRFSEGLPSVHFHLFPRTRILADRWVRENEEAARSGINGPLLFAWARIKFGVSDPEMLSGQTFVTAERIRKNLLNACKEERC